MILQSAGYSGIVYFEYRNRNIHVSFNFLLMYMVGEGRRGCCPAFNQVNLHHISDGLIQVKKTKLNSFQLGVGQQGDISRVMPYTSAFGRVVVVPIVPSATTKLMSFGKS